MSDVDKGMIICLFRYRACFYMGEFAFDPDRIEKSWYGGAFPIVDVHDTEVRWKNRRVEFIMEEGE